MISPVSRFARLSALCLAVAIAGCASHGSEFLGKWVNTQNPNDTYVIERNGDQFLLTGQNTKAGLIYKDGALVSASQGLFGGAALTYIKKTDTITAPGLFGQIEYKRGK